MVDPNFALEPICFPIFCSLEYMFLLIKSWFVPHFPLSSLYPSPRRANSIPSPKDFFILQFLRRSSPPLEKSRRPCTCGTYTVVWTALPEENIGPRRFFYHIISTFLKMSSMNTEVSMCNSYTIMLKLENVRLFF